MKTTRSPLIVALAGVLAAFTAGACVPDGASQFLYITGNSVVESDCTFSATEVGPFRSGGTLDVVLARQYNFAASVKNAMPSSIALQGRTLGDPRLEANIVQLERATVRYEYPDDPAFQDLPQLVGTSFSEFVGITVGPGAVSGVSIPLLAPTLAAEISNKLPPRDELNPAPGITLVTKIRVAGQMLDGTAVETDEFLYPINICKGCLLFFPTEAATPGAGPNCRNEENPPQLADRCLLGQDQSVDCRICRELKPIALRTECEPF